MATVLALVLTVLLSYRIGYVVYKVKRVKGAVRYYCLVEPLSPFSALWKPSPWNPTINHAWDARDRYIKYNAEAILFVPLLVGDVSLHVISGNALKHIYGDVTCYVKPWKASALDLMGPNVVTLNGEQWRRHRKITAPAFDNQIYQDVWRVVARLYTEIMVTPAWKAGNEHYFETFNVITTRLALLVIAACGLNMDIGWEGSLTREDLSHSVDSTMVTVSSSILPRVILPKFAYYLPIESIRRIDLAFTELRNFLSVEVASKKSELAEDTATQTLDTLNKNLFSRIVAASEMEGKKGLNEDEMIGNLFIFLFAGHETTASTLVATLALLALYQDEQERVYRHIHAVVGDREMVYDDYNALAPVLHCFYEALRLYPAATNSVRVTTHDTTLRATGLTPTGDSLFLSKGTEVVVDMIGACRSPLIYEDPHAFKPLRWTASDGILDNFLAFSTGPRQCLGKKFSTVEAVCFLSHMLRDWKFDVKLQHGETTQQWQERVMHPKIAITLKLDDVPLRVIRRRVTKPKV